MFKMSIIDYSYAENEPTCNHVLFGILRLSQNQDTWKSRNLSPMSLETHAHGGCKVTHNIAVTKRLNTRYHENI